MIRKILFASIVLVNVLLLSQCFLIRESTVRYSYNDDTIYQDGPVLFVIPGTYVYFSTYGNEDLFFYGGYWWRPWKNAWFRATVYTGDWIAVDDDSVPDIVVHLPSRWRENSYNSSRVRWGDARDHWREWEQDRRWDKQGWKNNDPEIRQEKEREPADQKRSKPDRPRNNIKNEKQKEPRNTKVIDNRN